MLPFMILYRNLEHTDTASRIISFITVCFIQKILLISPLLENEMRLLHFSQLTRNRNKLIYFSRHRVSIHCCLNESGQGKNTESQKANWTFDCKHTSPIQACRNLTPSIHLWMLTILPQLKSSSKMCLEVDRKMKGTQSEALFVDTSISAHSVLISIVLSIVCQCGLSFITHWLWCFRLLICVYLKDVRSASRFSSSVIVGWEHDKDSWLKVSYWFHYCSSNLELMSFLTVLSLVNSSHIYSLAEFFTIPFKACSSL